MAEQAEFTVKNVKRDEDRGGDMKVSRKLPDGTIDLDTLIPKDESAQIPILDTETSLIITPPVGIADINGCYVWVEPNTDVAVSYSRTNSNWAIKIVPNGLPPYSPTTVNVDVGEGRPG
jgi:hypothetical protein